MNNIKKSKEYITDALFQLLDKKNYNEITITDISEKAGVTRITFYRNFENKDDIVKQALNEIFDKYKWDTEKDTGYQIFDFFSKNKKIIDLLYKTKLQLFLIDNFLKRFDYKSDEESIFAYSKVMITYLIFGLCDEWYKRGMKETPDEIFNLFNKQKNNE